MSCSSSFDAATCCFLLRRSIT
eukprot:COSAG06_NODE_41455_length_391_cov_0.845890_1_plen_21_part_10